LAVVEKERELKLGAKDRSMALQQKENLDAKVVARLRREQDELCQTMERLHSENGVARGERDLVIRDRDEAQ